MYEYVEYAAILYIKNQTRRVYSSIKNEAEKMREMNMNKEGTQWEATTLAGNINPLIRGLRYTESRDNREGEK